VPTPVAMTENQFLLLAAFVFFGLAVMAWTMLA
jgi:hypothetical protein